MLKEADFENMVWELLFAYRQLLLNGNLHKEIGGRIYRKNPATWNTILFSLETGVVLGLAKLLEEQYFGRNFADDNLNIISGKIMKIRKKLIAHNDLSIMRNKASFLEENKLYGGDIIKIIDALKKRAIEYQKSFGTKINIQELFKETTRNAMEDLHSWLKFFRL